MLWSRILCVGPMGGRPSDGDPAVKVLNSPSGPSKCLNLLGPSPTLRDELTERTLTLVSDTNSFNSSLVSLYQQGVGGIPSVGSPSGKWG